MCEYPKTITLSRSSGQEKEFLIRRCTEADLLDVTKLQLKVYEGLPDPGLYAPLEEEFVRESLLEDYCFGAYSEGRLAGFTMMVANRVSDRNYGSYVGYSEERQKKCVTMELSIVDSEFRGYGLQKLFVAIREEEARRAGATEALVSVAPDNEYSLANLINSGYVIIDTRPLHEGEIRHILSKNLNENKS